MTPASRTTTPTAITSRSVSVVVIATTSAAAESGMNGPPGNRQVSCASPTLRRWSRSVPVQRRKQIASAALEANAVREWLVVASGPCAALYGERSPESTGRKTQRPPTSDHSDHPAAARHAKTPSRVVGFGADNLQSTLRLSIGSARPARVAGTRAARAEATPRDPTEEASTGASNGERFTSRLWT